MNPMVDRVTWQVLNNGDSRGDEIHKKNEPNKLISAIETEIGYTY